MPEKAIFEEGIIVFEVDDNSPNIKITIDSKDISADIDNSSFTCVSKDSLSHFNFELNNYKGKYNEGYAEGDTVLIYLDNSAGTTLQLRGKIDILKPSLSSDYSISISGRNRPEMVDVNDLIINFDEENVVDAAKAAIDLLNSRVGYTVVSYDSFPTSDITISRDFRNVSLLDILRMICQLAGWEFRIGNDENGTIEFINRGDASKKVTDVITSGVNFQGTDGISKDSTYIKNRITVYGQNVEGCLVMWTVGDAPYNPWLKTETINDTSCLTRLQCKDRAQLEYNEKNIARNQGEVLAIGLVNLIPAYSIDVFIPYVITGTFVIKEYSHRFSVNGWDTSIVLDQLSDFDFDLTRKNTERVKEQQDLNNPNGMLFSELFTFDDDSTTESSSGVNISNGKLKLNSGIDQGTWVSKPITSPVEIASGELRFNGNDDCDLSKFELTADNENFETVTAGTKGGPGVLNNFTNKGKNIKVRITLKSDTDNTNPEIESLSELWKA